MSKYERVKYYIGKVFETFVIMPFEIICFLLVAIFG